MPPAVRNISLGTWIAVCAFLLQGAVYLVTYSRSGAAMSETVKALGVTVIEMKEVAKEDRAAVGQRFEAVERTVNDHERRVYYLERRTP